MTNTAKRKAYLNKVERKKIDNEPKLSEDNYASDFLGALNYYNSEYDNKTKKGWALNYIAQIDPTLADKVSKVDDWHFAQYGSLARLMSRGQNLSTEHLRKMNELLARIKDNIPAAEPVAKPVATAKVVSIQDKILEKAREHAGEIEGEIDEFILAGCPKDYKLKAPIKSWSPPVLKYIASVYTRTAKELAEAIKGDDDQLVEGYSNFKKVELKRFHAFVETIIQAAQQQVVVAKATRKPRARKAKPAGVIAAKVKYMSTFDEYGLKSELPSKIVDSEEVWIYNTKYRKLIVYKPANGGLLSVKGTTITNFDISTSMSKTLRKPEEIKNYATMTKRPLNTAFKALTTKPAVPNGRINEECIILKVF